MKISGKTAVVTGGASGIGKATAEALAEAGAHVIIGDLDAANGEAVAASIRARGQGADYLRLDVADLASVAEFKAGALALRPQVDIVANVAGWGKIQPFMENTPEFWRKVMDVNLLGPVAVTHAFLPGMIERKSGKVVTVSSDAGRVGSLGETVYSGAKGGAIAFTKSLAREVARHNINVNCVCPGPRPTRRCCAPCPRSTRRPSSRPPRCAAWPSPRKSPTRSCSSPATAPPSSPARPSASVVA
jgi:2-hydroxycyclohexanecarboxyl-CoA dehydrogenase